MWANICCSKYSHSRVTTFRTHMKHNNDFTKLIYPEKHLPHHMRFNLGWRIIRFLFYPICMLGCIMILNQSDDYHKRDVLCRHRNVCMAYCTDDNFPLLSCELMQEQRIIGGNEYEHVFKYPNPEVTKATLGLFMTPEL